MESVVHATSARAATERAAAVPWYVVAMLVGSTSIAIGLLWDISWHMTIGRDSFWTPAHMAIYLGGVVAGLCCGWLALKTTFAGTAELRDTAVRFWGFRAPLGAWVAVWGAIAMLTSAPFDDWWHSAYGLDVKILSPPHSLLAAGMIAIQLGAMLLVLARLNRAQPGSEGGLGLAHLYAAGVVVLMAAIMMSEYVHPNSQHGGFFYQVASGAFPLLLVGVARSSRLRWAATWAALFYMLVICAMVWILPLFPAQPLLGPINNPVAHMVPPVFPLLLVVPALGIDLVLRRRPGKQAGWLDAALLAAVFLGLFFVTQWLFSEFLLSPASRNWFFAGDQHWSYGSTPGEWQYRFWNLEGDPLTFRALGGALGIAFASTRLGLWWGAWMARVKR